MILLLKSVQSYDLYFQVSMGYYVELGPIAKSKQQILKRSRPVGYAAEYLIPSLSDVLATIALPHSVTYLLRGVNGETLDIQFPNSPSPPHTSLCLSTRYVTYRNM